MEEIENLVKQAEELRSCAFNSPKVDFWENRVRRFLKANYSESDIDKKRDDFYEYCIKLGGLK